jgi:hypothetical protein
LRLPIAYHPVVHAHLSQPYTITASNASALMHHTHNQKVCFWYSSRHFTMLDYSLIILYAICTGPRYSFTTEFSCRL